MSDLEQDLRRVLKEPPPDPAAKERALLRLRTHINAPYQPDRVPVKRRRLIRFGAVALAPVIAVVAVLTLSLNGPAAAREAERLGHANAEWASTFGVPDMRVEQWSLSSYSRIDGSAPTYRLVVRSMITLSEDDGAVQRQEKILSRDFYSPTDQEAWRQNDSPSLPKVGDITTDTFENEFDRADMSTDPEELRLQLEDGEILGYAPDPGQLFELIAYLLSDPNVDAAQRIALYRVIASIDEVELIGEVPDPLGRVGVGFSYDQGRGKQVLIFDRDTGQPLAYEEFLTLDPTQLGSWQAFDPPI
jgi:hypothetical protein